MLGGQGGRLSHMVMDAVWLYCNYIRPHMTLGDTVPAQKAGMSITCPNRLMMPIQNAAMSKFAIPHPQWTENLERACRAA